MSFTVKDFKRLAGRAIFEYGMIQDGDRILVGLSGGKDSIAMLAYLWERLPRIPVSYTLVAAHLDLGYEDAGQTKALEQYVKSLGIDYIFEKTDYAPKAHTGRGRENPCFYCSRSRRKRLFELARDYECGKIALGHHRDDLIETLLMNIFFSGEISTMRPVQEFFGGLINVVRPLYMTPEALIKKVVKAWELPLVLNHCPSDSNSRRADVKEIIRKLAAVNDKVRGNMFNSLSNYRPEYLLKKVGENTVAGNNIKENIFDGISLKEQVNMDEEQRKRTRVNFHALVDLDSGEKRLKGLESRDLSLKGLFVITEERMGKGVPVDVTLDLSGSSSKVSLKMKGKIARIDEEGMAVDFTEVDLDSFYHLRNIILYNSGEPNDVDDELVNKPAF